MNTFLRPYNPKDFENHTYFTRHLILLLLAISSTVIPTQESSVQPKPCIGIGNRNQDQVSVSVSGPELFLPKPKLSSMFSSLIFLVWKSHWYRVISLF